MIIPAMKADELLIWTPITVDVKLLRVFASEASLAANVPGLFYGISNHSQGILIIFLNESTLNL